MVAPKKDVEIWRLECFKSFIADFPKGEVVPTEEPDFLIRGHGHIVGIELTDLHHQTAPGRIPEQASEAMRRRVVARAQEIYISRQLQPVMASFFLDDRIHIKKSEVEALAEEFANVIAANCPAPNSSIEVPQGWEDTRALPSILHSVSIRRLDVVTKTFFSAPGATWVPTITREDVERALSGKELKYDSYMTKCDEVWLVINTDTESMTTYFEFDPEILSRPFSTQFDHVFLVQHLARKAYELARDI
ncbi:hypothetical protein [Burkholderia multivorans]|uniref:hypothetical protein n=1 Tax=Burkholderia multivorans TaxID=87883 RepID=UPI001C24419A|nr:hypothetical protein [Burkholderia multivorans]MBU9491753.1 hypothetical protein [Burkholderia multivorans]